MSISRHIPLLEVPLSTPTQAMALELEDAASEGCVRLGVEAEGSLGIGGSGEFVSVDVSKLRPHMRMFPRLRIATA